jgi:hypothetical protein
MADESLQAEVERLRSEVQSYRERELADMRSALAVAREESAHYKAEAFRNAEVGREIDATYRERIAALQSQLEAARNMHVTSRRPVNANA